MTVLFHQEGNTLGFFRKFLLVSYRTGLFRTLMMSAFLFACKLFKLHPIRLEWCAALFGVYWSPPAIQIHLPCLQCELPSCIQYCSNGGRYVCLPSPPSRTKCHSLLLPNAPIVQYSTRYCNWLRLFTLPLSLDLKSLDYADLIVRFAQDIQVLLITVARSNEIDSCCFVLYA